MGLAREFSWLISVPIFLEYEDVLNRTEHLASANLDASDILVLMDQIILSAERVILMSPVMPNDADPSDAHLISLARDGNAHAVVTHNKRHFTPAVQTLGVNLYSPAEALAKIEGRQ